MSAPSELLQIGLDASKFDKAGANEWRGPCPFCGGTDRFRVHTDRPFPHWYTVCREGTGCGWSGWADQINPRLREPMTAEKLKEYAARQKEQERRQAQSLAERLKEFSDSELWAELNRRMSEKNRAWWESQGLPETAQDYWQLGYTTQTAWGEAYTIPFFSEDWKAVNMQYRLLHPPENGDKYRWRGLGYSSHFTAFPALKESEQVVICEGAKKAMVYAYHISPADVRVYGVPSKSDFAGVADKAKNASRVWIVLDPDAEAQAMKLAHEIGKAARIVTLTEKIDDLITLYGARERQLSAYFRQARKVQ